MKVPQLIAEGVVTEIRALKATKSGNVFAWLVKLACTGITLELQSREEPKLGAGQVINAVCGLELYNGALKPLLQSFTVSKA